MGAPQETDLGWAAVILETAAVFGQPPQRGGQVAHILAADGGAGQGRIKQQVELQFGAPAAGKEQRRLGQTFAGELAAQGLARLHAGGAANDQRLRVQQAAQMLVALLNQKGDSFHGGILHAVRRRYGGGGAAHAARRPVEVGAVQGPAAAPANGRRRGLGGPHQGRPLARPARATLAGSRQGAGGQAAANLGTAAPAGTWPSHQAQPLRAAAWPGVGQQAQWTPAGARRAGWPPWAGPALAHWLARPGPASPTHGHSPLAGPGWASGARAARQVC